MAEESGLADSSWMEMLPNIQEAIQKGDCENGASSSEEKEDEEAALLAEYKALFFFESSEYSIALPNVETAKIVHGRNAVLQ